MSWLDHVVSTTNGYNTIVDLMVDNSYITSDHFVTSFSLDMNRILVDAGDWNDIKRTICQIKWNNMTSMLKSKHLLYTILDGVGIFFWGGAQDHY